MISRRNLLCAAGLGFLSVPFTVDAQTAPRTRKIGVITNFVPDETPLTDLRQGLRELGYAEGRDITIEWRSIHGENERYPDLASELVNAQVDVIVAGTNAQIAAVQRATKTIPIVMVHPTDPIKLGFVPSLTRPEGNITGLSLQSRELSGKRLQLLKEAVPTLSRLLILWDPDELGFRETVVREAEAAAPAVGLHVQLVEVHSSSDVDSAFAIIPSRAGAIFVPGGTIFSTNRIRIVELAAKKQLATTCGAPRSAEAGCLMYYGANFADQYRRAAYFVDRILRGAKTADLPVEQPTKFELVINLKTAKAIGLTIPPSLLQRADQVIE